jgi:hypothetical protein
MIDNTMTNNCDKCELRNDGEWQDNERCAVTHDEQRTANRSTTNWAIYSNGV